MSLADFESAVLQVVVDALEDCDQTPSPVVRYHGFLPNVCCTEAGTLSCSWEESPAQGDCPGPSTWNLLVRWVICWPSMEPKGGNVQIDYPLVDAKAARIARVAECVEQALLAEVCAGAQGELASHVVGGTLKVGRTTPIVPGGLCAGVAWRIVGAVKTPASPS